MDRPHIVHCILCSTYDRPVVEGDSFVHRFSASFFSLFLWVLVFLFNHLFVTRLL